MISESAADKRDKAMGSGNSEQLMTLTMGLSGFFEQLVILCSMELQIGIEIEIDR